MPKYTVDYLYNEFGQLAGMRTDSKYSNDAGYWTGGRCNWGGSHNLREDCGTLAKGFEKMESLDGEKIKAELNKCTSQGEYESKKADYIRKANEISPDYKPEPVILAPCLEFASSRADQAMSPYVENKMQDCRRNLENLKSQLGIEKYQHVEELRILKLEQKKIEARMQENKRKAMNEKDPTKRAKFLQLIDEDSKKLEENLKQQQAIPQSGINFDPNKHVSDMINGMKKAIERSRKGGGDGGDPDKPRKPKKPDDPWDDEDDNKGDGDKNDNDNKRPPRKKNQPEQNNQQMLLIGVIVLVVLFLLMNQKEQSNRREDYDYDY